MKILNANINKIQIGDVIITRETYVININQNKHAAF